MKWKAFLTIFKGLSIKPITQFFFERWESNFNQAIKLFKVDYFPDVTNFLYLGESIQKLNKHVNINLKSLADWSNARKTSLNVKITEMASIKSKREMSDKIEKKSQVVVLKMINISLGSIT